jgi:hypothetical protein
MSISWYISAFENKKEQNIPTTDIMKIFSEYKIKKSNDGIDIELDGDRVTVFVDLTKDKISYLSVSRPIASNELNKILFKIMKLGNFILYVPEGVYPIIVNKNIEKEFPDDMIKTLGKPKIAENEEEFSLLLNKIYG